MAKNGLGTSYPNPLVGCVIVNNDKIIGEGWHYKAGFPHAEVNAIASVPEANLLEESILYVSLEPCSHFGKTPPCSDLIISKRIKKIVIGSTDPNPQVAGRGIKKLQEAGCDVVVGVLQKECEELNKRFFTFHGQKRPYIFLKWAETRDGFVAPKRSDRTEVAPVWITNEFSRQLAHKMRGLEMGILVGTNTILQDNPSLTTRDWAGSNPLRIGIDKEGVLSPKLCLFDGKVKTITFTSKTIPSKANVEFERIDFSKKIVSQICRVLYKKGLQSLIVEGGTKTIQSFIDANLWDEAIVFVGRKTFRQGVKAPSLNGVAIRNSTIKDDSLTIFKNPLR